MSVKAAGSSNNGNVLQASGSVLAMSHPMKAQDVAGWMRSLEFAEECGDWDCIETWLNSKYFAWIEKFADAQLLARIAEWRGKLAVAREYEAVHGRGSLYVKDHPFNVRMEEKMRRRRERLEAATLQ